MKEIEQALHTLVVSTLHSHDKDEALRVMLCLVADAALLSLSLGCKSPFSFGEMACDVFKSSIEAIVATQESSVENQLAQLRKMME